MLTMSKAIQAGQGEYYLSLAGVDDYYAAGTEPPGYWLGRGAAALGLGGELNQEHFRQLLRGLSPGGDRKLVRNADYERRAGWDLTWSAPKSVSVAWSQADPQTRARLEACLRRAAAEGIAYLEAVAGISRRGEDGRIHEAAGLVLAAFLHSTSRAQDPQLHLHTILLNVGVRADGTTGTLEPKGLYRHQMAAGALFRAELAALLETELGLRARRENRAFELLGVDPELIAFFSKRRAQIEAELARLGQSGGRAAERANFATRAVKEARPRAELFAEWQRIGHEHHWSAKELSWMIEAPFPARRLEWERAAAGTEALAQLTASQSHFCRRQIVQAVAECCQGRGLGAEVALRLSEELLRSPELIPLGEHRGTLHYTTREILALEKSVLASAKAMQQRRELLPTDWTEEAIARHSRLTGEQTEALRHLCAARGGLTLVHGLAGTGKSTLFAVAHEVWTQQGLSVHGAALSGKAARGLEEAAGIPSTTLHRLLGQLRNGDEVLHDRSVVVLDEASMIGTRQLAEVVTHCSRAGAALVLCGDSRQLQALELGGLFAALTDRLETSHLIDIQRQREPWARESVKHFAFGRAEEALLPYRQRGLVAELRHEITAMDRMLADWRREALPDLKNSLMLAGTTAEVMELNRRAQEEQRHLGLLGDTPVGVGPDPMFTGDRVLFTRNSPVLGVANGDLGLVQSAQGRTLSVTMDDGRAVAVPLDRYPHLRLGYALTTHKAQGMTVERAFILTSGVMADRELTYVQASRARGTTRWYVGHDLEEVTQRMTRSHEKLAAVSLAPGPELELTLVR